MVKWVRINEACYKLTGHVPAPTMAPGSRRAHLDRMTGEALPALEKKEPGSLL